MPNDIGELTSRQQSTQKLLYDAERQAAQQITKTQKRTREEQAAEETKLQQVRDQYEKMTEAERLRHETSLVNAKNKGYENVRETQRDIQKQVSQTRSQGGDELLRLNEHYRNTIYKENQKTDSDIKELQNNHFQMQEFERKKSENTTELLKKDMTSRLAELENTQQTVLEGVKTAAQNRYETTRANTELATQEAEENFNNNYKKTIQTQQEALGSEMNRASTALNTLRADHSRKLSAYDARAADPFYQIVGFGGKLQELEDEFIVTAQVPEHERSQIAVSMRGNELVITGRRQNSDAIELESGSKQTTNSYQSYSESHQLSYPVDARGIRREFEGDTLVIHIPKHNTYSAPMHKRKDVERVQAERPKFPDHLGEPQASGQRPDLPDKPLS